MRLARATWPWLLGLVAIAACEGGGCGGCGGAYLAEAAETSSEVARDFSGSVGQWEPCEAGARFGLGDGLRTGAGASALLSMQPSGSVLVEENTTIRFELNEQTEARRLELESGSVTVETAVTDLEVASADSVTVIQRGSKVSFEQREGGRAAMHVRAGRAVIEADGREQVVRAGQKIVLEVGGVVVEEAVDEEAEAQPEAEGEPERESDPGPGLGGPFPRKEDDKPFEVQMAPGETATIHDPTPPSHVAFQLPCERGGVVEVARGGGSFRFREGRGRDHASVTLPVGAFRYRVRCLDAKGAPEAPSAGGHLRVVADAATRRLPAKAQRVRMDADGRNYRIQYSNRLPLFTFTWRDAPAADGYELHVELPNGRKLVRRQSSDAEVMLREGTIGEGEYHYWFQSSDGRSSKPTTLDVTFQNQGRTAYLAGALEAGATDGTLRLRGGALAQSQVTVGDQEVQLDAQGRFRTDIASPEDGHVSVRVAHPATGVHYYVRRVP